MSGLGFPCWQCGRPAPGGVCLGPHEGYDHRAAVSAQMVMNLDRPERALTYIGASIDYETSPHRKAYKRRYREAEKHRIAQYRLDRKVRVQLAIAARIERMSAA